MDTTIQIRHVPRALHRRLRARATMEGLSLSEFMLHEAERIARTPSREEIRALLATLPRIDSDETVEEMIRKDRDAL